MMTRRNFLCSLSGVAILFLGSRVVQALDTTKELRFSAEERRLIEEYYKPNKKDKKKGLPPGLAKRGGNLPPGLQKKLDRDGKLPPGLQKRLEPLPTELNQRLPRLPEFYERVILERDVVLVDRRTHRVLDIIENVIGIISGR